MQDMRADAFRFPFDSFSDEAAFATFAGDNQSLLDMRYRYEMDLARNAPGQILCNDGSCGLCLRATRFTTHKPTANPGSESGAGEPNWWEQQICACPEKLNARFRALLQFILGHAETFPWTRLLLLGAAQPIEQRLRAMVARMDVRARSGAAMPRAAPAAPPAYHLVISSELLHEEPCLDQALSALHAVLVPGGRLVFTARFDTRARHCRSGAEGEPGMLGWDLLDRLARAGFQSAAANLLWSDEFGYLGTFNLIFSATA